MKGGKRKGAGRKPALRTGKRKHFYLAPDLVEWWEAIPGREKSVRLNQIIRDALAKTITQ